MPVHPLPNNASFEHLKKQAKRLLTAAREGDARALALVTEFHPKPPAPDALALHDAQIVVARSYAFKSWAKLKAHVEDATRFSWDPTTPAAATTPGDRLIELACLDYGKWRPENLAEAMQLLAGSPAVTHESIHAAAAAGDVAAVRSFIATDRALANALGGPYRWPPLLYACYSRLRPGDGRSTLEAARILLGAGADPNAGFLWCGNVPPFTALTGAFGEGEDGNNQPPHPDRDELARLLLDAGADPNDGQTLYNRHFRRDDGHLKLLLAYGLGRDANPPGPWLSRFAERMGTPADLLVEELWIAAHKNFKERVELLVAHGADVNAKGHRDGRTPYEAAMAFGNREIADYLVAHGARRVELPPEQEFAAACVGGRGAEARRLLANHPQLFDDLGVEGRAALVRRAVEAGRREGVRLLADLGFELDSVGASDRTPLHEAAWSGDLEMVQLLVQLGASTAVRDAAYHGTPLGWAHHNRQHAVVAWLLPSAPLVDALECGGVERVAELLMADPTLASAAAEDGNALVFHLHGGIERLDEMIAVLRSAGADFGARDRLGRSLDEALEARDDKRALQAIRRVA